MAPEFSRETELIGYRYKCGEGGGERSYCKELAHTVAEAEDCRVLPSASCRPRKASGEGLGARRDHHVSLSLRAGEYRWLRRAVRRREAKSSLPLPFCSIQALSKLHDAHPHWGRPSALFSLPIQMLISSRDTLTDTLWNNIWPDRWAPSDPLKLTDKIKQCM